MFDIIAIDWGESRSGVAFGDSKTQLIVPYAKEILTKDIFNTLDNQIKEKKIKIIVIGLPQNFFSLDTKLTKSVHDFVAILKLRYKELEVMTVNESGTTQKVRSKLGRDKIQEKIKISNIDNLAAQEILQLYFDYKT